MQHQFWRTAGSVAVLTGVLGLFAYKSVNETPVNLKVDPKAIVLPVGFSAKIIAENLGKTRHLAVAKNGDVYVKLSKLKDGKGIYRLRDADRDGTAEEQKLFGDYPGTGIAIKNGYLYSSSNQGVYRYKLNEKEEVIDEEHPETLVDGLLDHNRDNAKTFALDDKGNLYVTIGSYSDDCRQPGTGIGASPCTILDSAGGIWKFRADKLHQTFADGRRYATGVKNAVALDWDSKTNALYTVIHGRGKFHDFYPEYFTAQQSAELPSEAFYKLKEGDDAGWPYSYYDHIQKKKIQAPEYGGDGKKLAQGKVIDPVVGFPAHLGPNDLLFYTGNQFPARYKNGAFVAFHNQSSELKKGFFVAFVPFVNGKAGKWEIFADNFAGIDLAKPTGPVQHRPCGLAQGQDGSLYVTDDLNGTIFKIDYKKK